MTGNSSTEPCAKKSKLDNFDLSSDEDDDDLLVSIWDTKPSYKRSHQSDQSNDEKECQRRTSNTDDSSIPSSSGLNSQRTTHTSTGHFETSGVANLKAMFPSLEEDVLQTYLSVYNMEECIQVISNFLYRGDQKDDVIIVNCSTAENDMQSTANSGVTANSDPTLPSPTQSVQSKGKSPKTPASTNSSTPQSTPTHAKYSAINSNDYSSSACSTKGKSPKTPASTSSSTPQSTPTHYSSSACSTKGKSPKTPAATNSSTPQSIPTHEKYLIKNSTDYSSSACSTKGKSPKTPASTSSSTPHNTPMHAKYSAKNSNDYSSSACSTKGKSPKTPASTSSSTPQSTPTHEKYLIKNNTDYSSSACSTKGKSPKTPASTNSSTPQSTPTHAKYSAINSNDYSSSACSTKGKSSKTPVSLTSDFASPSMSSRTKTVIGLSLTKDGIAAAINCALSGIAVAINSALAGTGSQKDVKVSPSDHVDWGGVTYQSNKEIKSLSNKDVQVPNIKQSENTDTMKKETSTNVAAKELKCNVKQVVLSKNDLKHQHHQDVQIAKPKQSGNTSYSTRKDTVSDELRNKRLQYYGRNDNKNDQAPGTKMSTPTASRNVASSKGRSGTVNHDSSTSTTAVGIDIRCGNKKVHPSMKRCYDESKAMKDIAKRYKKDSHENQNNNMQSSQAVTPVQKSHTTTASSSQVQHPTTPARTTPARTTPAKTTPARTTPARTTPARSTPARTTQDATCAPTVQKSHTTTASSSQAHRATTLARTSSLSVLRTATFTQALANIRKSTCTTTSSTNTVTASTTHTSPASSRSDSSRASPQISNRPAASSCLMTWNSIPPSSIYTMDNVPTTQTTANHSNMNTVSLASIQGTTSTTSSATTVQSMPSNPSFARTNPSFTTTCWSSTTIYQSSTTIGQNPVSNPTSFVKGNQHGSKGKGPMKNGITTSNTSPSQRDIAVNSSNLSVPHTSPSSGNAMGIPSESMNNGFTTNTYNNLSVPFTSPSNGNAMGISSVDVNQGIENMNSELQNMLKNMITRNERLTELSKQHLNDFQEQPANAGPTPEEEQSAKEMQSLQNETEILSKLFPDVDPNYIFYKLEKIKDDPNRVTKVNEQLGQQKKGVKSDGPAKTTVSWSWEGEDKLPGTFNSFAEAESNYIELHFKRYKGQVMYIHFSEANRPLAFDFKVMRMTDYATGRSVRIQRSDGNQNIENQSSVSNDKLQRPAQKPRGLIEVFPGTSEFCRVESLLKKSIQQAHVTEVNRVDNSWLQQTYNMQYELLKQKNGAANVNIKELFHGTRETAPDVIWDSEHGFDMRFSGECMWGRGCYFAVHAAYSHAYSYKTYKQHKKYYQLFLAHVITGDSAYLEPNRSIKKPPYNERTGRDYDSINGITKGHPIYVLYNNAMSYPVYLITYTL